MKKIIITDIGSTTTKAIFLEHINNKLQITALANSVTTVESPEEDVRIGVFNSIKELEKENGKALLDPKSTADNLTFNNDITYLATSSAGGGLQILVIGLTLADSAKSAQRAAFGAGGVLLDTLAINDMRSTREQLDLIHNSHPDIVIISGGTDGGAYTGIIRLAEILSLGKPSPKFATSHRIPLIYAGNIEAQKFMKTLFSNEFDLSILPNIRPSLEEENLEPITDKIHEIFLNSVMENAPGYAELKNITDSDILPTPLAVLKSVDLVEKEMNSTLLKVDIGGATTDIFSVINKKTRRTVSANYGMSYSISNVLANSDWEKIRILLPENIRDDDIRNYVGNKMLCIDHVPVNDCELCIEQAMAIRALKLSLDQHYEMHMNEHRFKVWEKMKLGHRDPFYDQMYQEKIRDSYLFHHSDVEVVIGCGGVISHAPDEKQALYITSLGLRVEGITKVFRDKHFISPHLGKLSDVNNVDVERLLINDCYEELGTVVNPLIRAKKENEIVLSITINDKNYSMKKNEVKYIKLTEKSKILIKLGKNAYIRDKDKKILLYSDKSLLLMTFEKSKVDYQKIIKEMELYNLDTSTIDYDAFKRIDNNFDIKKFREKLSLPYEGTLLFGKGDKIRYNEAWGLNNYAYPKIYIINLSRFLGKSYPFENLKQNKKIYVGAEIKYGQLLIDEASSPVVGIITNINYKSGIILVKEKQNYSEKPVTFGITHVNNMKSSKLLFALKIKKGDFVFEGENVFNTVQNKRLLPFGAPASGYVTNIDLAKGKITIQYKKEPRYYCFGIDMKVIDKSNNMSLLIEYNAVKCYGKIGFGKENYGKLLFINDVNDDTIKSDDIVVLNNVPSYQDLLVLRDKEIRGLVVPSINQSVVRQIIGKEIGVALTGNENISYGIVIMQGFGKYSFTDNFIDIVKMNIGKNSRLVTTTQIRAGVTRPCLVISKDDDEK